MQSANSGRISSPSARDLHALKDVNRRRAAIEAQVLYVSSELARQPATMTAQSTNALSIGATDTEKRVRDLEQRRQELMARRYMRSNPVLAGATAELNTAGGLAGNGRRPPYWGLDGRAAGCRCRLDAKGVNAAWVLAAAQCLLEDGTWPVFGWTADLAGGNPDWFLDPATRMRAPSHAYCFSIPFRDEHRVGNVKAVWEVSRLQHVTVLGAAYHLAGEARFAERALQHLRSWWDDNPRLRRIHWTSGIELGLRRRASGV
jgi:hypothetical protein